MSLGTITRSTRLIVFLSALGVISIGAIVGWLTGFFAEVVGRVGALWTGFTSWISQSLDWSHVLACAGFLLIPALILVIFLALTDS